jgi:hypothetical protein
MAACTTTEQEFSSSDLRVNPLDDTTPTPTTPPDERIADVMREAKQQYDDGHYVTSLRMSEQAESLMRQHRYPRKELALALTIQGFSLLQLGYVDDYYVREIGIQRGALSKFDRANQEVQGDFRANLGIALSLFRRHGDHIRKAEVLGEGVVSLSVLRADLPSALSKEPSRERRAKLRDIRDQLKALQDDRAKLVATGYVFKDPYSVPPDANLKAVQPTALGTISEAEETLALHDLTFVLDEALGGAEIDAEDLRATRANLDKLLEHWKEVQKHWRMETLKDLQASRDRLLAARDELPDYFWVLRDLVFVYQALGAFFLDHGLQEQRLLAIKQGARGGRIEAEARMRYLADHEQGWAKTNSARNYRDALELTRVFISQHERFERLRVSRRDSTTFDDENTNPFLVDLVLRYRQTMDELIEEERNFRAAMILEAAVLCIDPLFQINDIPQAILWANRIQTLKVGDPIHHFVRGTAYFHGGQYADALDSYNAFLSESSITGDSGRRNMARNRVMQCERYLDRSSGAGEDVRRR